MTYVSKLIESSEYINIFHAVWKYELCDTEISKNATIQSSNKWLKTSKHTEKNAQIFLLNYRLLANWNIQWAWASHNRR